MRNAHSPLLFFRGRRFLLLGAFACLAACGDDSSDQQVSRPGEYSGYSEPIYSEWVTTSQYVPMRDGTLIAVDIHRPKEGPTRKLPAVLVMTPYHRASVKDGETYGYSINNPRSPYSEVFRTLVSYGYVVVVADIRGTGASFGYRFGIFSPIEVQDGSDLVDWIVGQDWCDGNVGMMGRSYMASIQYLNASNCNPHLKCIIPCYGNFDLYDFIYPGGILNSNFVLLYDLYMQVLNSNSTWPLMNAYPSKPVDEDPLGLMLLAATWEHRANSNLVSMARQLPYRDSLLDTPWGRDLAYFVASPASHLEEIERSGVAIYNMGGWLDCYNINAITFQETARNKSKILIGNYDHTQWFHAKGIECVRFFDRYLKGIQNGIDQEPPYYIYTTGREEWRFEEEWPLPEQEITPFYFCANGELSTTAPTEEGADSYRVDYTTTSGANSRWLAMLGIPSDYGERSQEDKKCLTYTTPALQRATEVTGHPILHLFVSPTNTDGDFFVYLEDVDENGSARYLSEGMLRASMRKLEPRPWMPDLPYHPCRQADRQELVPGETVELVIELFPISHLFREGHRIRVSLAGADANNFWWSMPWPPPTWNVSRGGDRASYIELPMIPSDG